MCKRVYACAETCVLNYIKELDGTYREPCAGKDIATCDEVKCGKL